MNRAIEISLFILTAAMIGFGCYCYGFSEGQSAKEREAVLGDFAEWNPHPETGEPVFNWK